MLAGIGWLFFVALVCGTAIWFRILSYRYKIDRARIAMTYLSTMEPEQLAALCKEHVEQVREDMPF